MRRHVSDFLDEQGVPQDHALRAKAMRQADELTDRICARDLAMLEAARVTQH